MTIQGDRRFQPNGIKFFDVRSQREMLLISEPGSDDNGWICWQHPDGQWVTLRKANGRDILSLLHARQEKTMEPLPRTVDEILVRLTHINSGTGDPMGTERCRLLEALPYSEAVAFLNVDAPHTEESWEAERTKSCESARGQIVEYLGTAWANANRGKGVEAVRSVSHFKGLVWLLGPGHDELYEKLDTAWYGKLAFVHVSNLVGIDWRQADDGEWQEAGEEGSITAEEALEKAGM